MGRPEGGGGKGRFGTSQEYQGIMARVKERICLYLIRIC